MIVTAKWMLSTLRIAGLASANHILATIFNSHASKLLAVERITFQHDDTAASAAISPLVRTYRSTAIAPTGGTALGKVLRASSGVLDAAVVVRGGHGATDDSAGAIAATASGGPGWAQFRSRGHTMVGQFLQPDDPVLPGLTENDPVILSQDEGLLLKMDQAGVATARYVINIAGYEYTV
jgi:hypothetical protein